MKKKFVLFFAMSIIVVIGLLFVGCGGTDYKYTYDFTLEGGKITYKSESTYEITKDSNTIGYIKVNGDAKEDGVYVAQKVENFDINIYFIEAFDRNKLLLTSPNATIVKGTSSNNSGVCDVTQYVPFNSSPTEKDPYYFHLNYIVSKDSKENFDINISGLEKLNAMNYNWEIYAVGTVAGDGTETINFKGSLTIVKGKIFTIGETFIINLSLKDNSKTLYQKYDSAAETIAITCVFDNDNYLVKFSDEQLFASIKTIKHGDRPKQLLRLSISNDMGVYLIIK